jgi:hypothetical protein
MEHPPFIDDACQFGYFRSGIFPLKMVIFHSYVSLPDIYRVGLPMTTRHFSVPGCMENIKDPKIRAASWVGVWMIFSLDLAIYCKAFQGCIYTGWSFQPISTPPKKCESRLESFSVVITNQ